MVLPKVILPWYDFTLECELPAVLREIGQIGGMWWVKVAGALWAIGADSSKEATNEELGELSSRYF
jgi:hypothetical protein